MFPQDKYFLDSSKNYATYLCKITLFLVFLTFNFQVLQSQEQNYVIGKVKKHENLKDQEIGFFLLKDYTHYAEKFQVVRKLNSDYAIVKFKKDPRPGIFSELELYILNSNWKSNQVAAKYKSGDYINIQVLDLKSFKAERDWKILNENGNFLKIEITEVGIQPFLESEQVIYIAKTESAKVETPVVGHDLSVNNINFAKKQYPSLNGDFLNISIKENVFNIDDIDLKNRTVLDEESDERIDQHATAIATLSVGGENSAKEGGGVAKGAIAFSSSFLDLLPDPVDYFVDNNIYVQNHSYGTQVSSEYGAEAAAYDQQVYESPQITHVFSAGNSGNETAADGTYEGVEGYANLTGNFKMSKNTLVIGATDEAYNILDRSSKGPAQDGRIKPELVAYATQGTSDAAALVSGSALIIQDLYLTKTGEYPEASMIKAVLITGAKDVGRKGPDFDSGYGSLNLENSLKIVEQDQFFQGTLKSEEIMEFQIQVPENTKEFKVTLSWIDPSANAGSGIALVNDLDLLIKDSNNNSWQPWVLNPAPNSMSLQDMPIRTKDHLNNTELISIDNPVEGTYTLQIYANLLEGIEQRFAIAYTTDIKDQFEWTFPNKDDGLILKDKHIVRWNSSYSETNAKVEINLNDTGWESINTSFNISDSFAELNLDENFSGIAQLKMIVEGKEYVSEQFVIAPQISPDLLFNCDQELLISWPVVENADGYKVFNLGEEYLETIAVTETNQLKILKDDLLSNYLSVVPVFQGVEGEKGLTIDISLQGVGCYVNTFFALLENDLSINSMLNLGTSINIQKVEFFKLIGQQITLLNTTSPPFSSLQLSSIDDNLGEGEVSYYAIITLNDGTTIRTNEIKFFIPGEAVFTIYPNPLENGEELTIISKGDDLDFYMFDMSGQRIFQDKLIQFQDRLEFPRLARGVYLLVAERNGERLGTRKVIIK